MAGLDFSSIMNKTLAEVERPPLPPVGTYRWQISKLFTVDKSKDGLWEIVSFPVRAVEALDDTDMSDYPGDVGGIMETVKFMFNLDPAKEVDFKKTEYRLRNFLENVLRVAEAGAPFSEALNATVGAQFIAPLTWRPGKEEGTFFTQLGNPGPVD